MYHKCVYYIRTYAAYAYYVIRIIHIKFHCLENCFSSTSLLPFYLYNLKKKHLSLSGIINCGSQREYRTDNNYTAARRECCETKRTTREIKLLQPATTFLHMLYNNIILLSIIIVDQTYVGKSTSTTTR